MRVFSFIIVSTLVLASFFCNCKGKNYSKQVSAISASEFSPKNISREQEALTQKINYLSGKFSPAKYKGFLVIPLTIANRKNMYLRKETLKAFKKMARVAAGEGISLSINSATRNYYSQKRIWESKFSGKRKVNGKRLNVSIPNEKKRALYILQWSSMPGTSRHHWGTDLDLSFTRKNPGVAFNNSAFEKGKGLKAYRWLRKNALKFGFCQPYLNSAESRQERSSSARKPMRGYNEEKWHWSYKPLSLQLLNEYNVYRAKLLPNGYLGDKVVASLYLDYVLNVSAECLN